MLQKPIERRPDPEHSPNANFIRLPNGPERLVGVGFRCWLAGYQTGDIECWETGWSLLARELGACGARAISSDLSIWVRAMHHAAARDIEIYPAGCVGFCRDECMAIAMVAAAQQDACPALKACAYALLDSNALNEVIETTSGLARTLRSEGIALSPDSVVIASAGMPASSATAH